MRDGKIVSYDAAYTFNLWGDTTLDAVFGVNAPVKIPQVSLDSYKKLTEEGKTLFCSCRTVPDGFTEIESGILTHTDETIDISVFTGKGVARTRSTQLSTYVESLSGVWVRAYLIYRDDEDGALYIAYSDPLQSI